MDFLTAWHQIVAELYNVSPSTEVSWSTRHISTNERADNRETRQVTQDATRRQEESENSLTGTLTQAGGAAGSTCSVVQ